MVWLLAVVAIVLDSSRNEPRISKYERILFGLYVVVAVLLVAASMVLDGMSVVRLPVRTL